MVAKEASRISLTAVVSVMLGGRLEVEKVDDKHVMLVLVIWVMNLGDNVHVQVYKGSVQRCI